LQGVTNFVSARAPTYDCFLHIIKETRTPKANPMAAVESSKTARGMVMVTKRNLVSTDAVFCNTIMRHNTASTIAIISFAFFILTSPP
jgi:hypothetical protein